MPCLRADRRSGVLRRFLARPATQAFRKIVKRFCAFLNGIWTIWGDDPRSLFAARPVHLRFYGFQPAEKPPTTPRATLPV